MQRPSAIRMQTVDQLIKDIQSLEQMAAALEMMGTTKALNDAKNAAGWELESMRKTVLSAQNG